MSIQFQETGNVDTECSSIIDYLVVAGGGGGGFAGGGGGAGGYRTSFPGGTKITLDVGTSSIPITIGAGGAGGASEPVYEDVDQHSIFSTITSAGGGRGGNYRLCRTWRGQVDLEVEDQVVVNQELVQVQQEQEILHQ
jgi:hypothetical protein